jgi:hypothetical protein
MSRVTQQGNGLHKPARGGFVPMNISLKPGVSGDKEGSPMRIQPHIGTGIWGLVLAVLVVAAAPTWASEVTAKIVTVQGLVEVLSSSPGQWVSAPGGRVLHPGDAVRTGSRSSATIELDGTKMTLYETTLLRIPISTSRVSTAGDSPWRHPSLDQGRGLFNVTPGRTPAGFSVRTPMLVAGVKGTIFEVVATGTEHAVYVWEGAVEVSSISDLTDLQLVLAGEYTMMDDSRLTPSQPMPVEQMRPEGAERDNVRPDSAMIEAWREADQIAVDLASDGMADFQTIVSSGELSQPVTTTLNSSTPSTSSVTDPLLSTTDTTTTSVIDPLTGLTTQLVDSASGLLGL